jgi:hypothetical protein
LRTQLVTEQVSKPVDIRPLGGAIDIEALSGHLTDVILDEVYSHVVDAEILRPSLHDAMDEKISCLAALIAGTSTLDDMAAPAALRFAAEVGGHGIPEQTFERSYRVGQETLWEWWMSVVQQHCDATGDSVVAVIRSSIPVLFGFVDRMLFVSLAAYHGAVAERRQTLEHRRLRLVEQVLDGTLQDPGVDAERLLGYRFGGDHLAGVASGPDAPGDRKLAARLKEACNATDLLVLTRARGATEFWLRLRAPLARATRQALAEVVDGAGCRVAFGDAAEGLPGFRHAVEGARDAARIQAMLGDNASRVTWADDVRIEILMLHDPTGARALIRNELGTALDEGLLTGRMRATLEAWLVTGSYVGAAAVLGVHEQTVRQRLRRLETTLGHSLNERRTELHVALRMSLVALPPA